MKCPHCQSRNKKTSRFCKKCGGELQLPTPPPSDGNCSACGTTNLAGSKFCKKCGHGLALADPSPEPEETTPTPAKVTPVPTEATTTQKVVAAGGVGSQLWFRLKRAKSDPTALLDPVGQTGGRFSFLEVFGVLIVCGLFVLLYAAGWKLWGRQEMLDSGSPVFLGFIIALLIALKTFRSLLDMLLRPVFRALSIFNPRLRIALGLLVPIVFAYLNREDSNMGFHTASWTIVKATLLGHILVRSTSYVKAKS